LNKKTKKREYKNPKVAKFMYWFENYFWYHYKWHTIIIGTLTAICLYLVISFVTAVGDDISVVICAECGMDSSNATEINSLIEENGIDVNGDGRVLGHAVLLPMMNPEQIQTHSAKIVAMSMQDEIVLYIYDLATIKEYGYDSFFEPLSTFGLEEYSNDGYKINITDCPIIKRSGLNAELYATIKVVPESYESDEHIRRAYECAVKVLKAILESK